MFKANTSLSVAETDYDTLKGSLIDFIKNKTEFTDYNFQGSTLQQIMNILAYNTYQNSFYQNMGLNESFLDTAQVRSNVVSNAKKLGYLAQSARASRASILLNFNPVSAPDALLVPKGTSFSAVKDSINYTFSTRQDYLAPKLDNGTYPVEVTIYEGIPVTQTFVYDPNVLYYELLNTNIDIDSLTVDVKSSTASTDSVRYNKVEDITDVTATSPVYFLQENYREKFELYFGNGVIGKQLQQGNAIVVTYSVCRANEPNGIRSFKTVGYAAQSVDGLTNYTAADLQTVTAATDGFAKEDTESIRFNSKHYHSIQNRFVTKSDYIHFIKNKYPFIESIQVWGGEEHIPPVYGKVIISAKPSDGYVLSELTKDEIRAELKNRNVMTIEPLFVDPIYLYVSPSITAYYDSTKTILDKTGVYNKIQTVVQDYEQSNLSQFNQIFQYGVFVNAIETADNSIESSETSVRLEKRFNPVIGSNLSYKIQFTNALKHTYDGYQGTLTSSAFKTNTSDQDQYLDDDGYGVVRSYYKNNKNEKVYVNKTAGTINYLTGEVSIKGLKVVSYTGDYIRIIVEPGQLNYRPLRNQIILLSFPTLNLYDLNTNQMVASNILDVNGNISFVTSDSIDIPVIF